ncbi:hypothetical protein B0H14DRAFT_2591971 [Mycena olivaceomarginata]|nr:hypothetical protein B0H14DRAFT_2591971 [Mycena olivaceomarginata]
MHARRFRPRTMWPRVASIYLPECKLGVGVEGGVAELVGEIRAAVALRRRPAEEDKQAAAYVVRRVVVVAGDVRTRAARKEGVLRARDWLDLAQNETWLGTGRAETTMRLKTA